MGTAPQPEVELAALLRTMEPQRRPGRFCFVALDGVDAPPGVVLEATVREPEGLSCVVSCVDADRLALPYDFVAAWITLRVHSSLAAVGLTAAVSARLAAVGVSANVIAGLRHDHVLVPEDRVQEALTALRALSAEAR